MFLNISFNCVSVIVSEIFLFFSILFLLLFSSFYFKKLKQKIKNIEIITKNLSLFILFIYLYIVFFSINHNIDFEIYFFNNLIKITKIVLIFITIWIILQDKPLKINKIFFFEISILFLSSLLSFSLMLTFNNLFLIYLFIELQSLIFFILVSIKRNKISFDSSLKYFIFGVIGSSFILYGISLVYGLFGTTNMYYINILFESLCEYTSEEKLIIKFYPEYHQNPYIYNQLFYCFLFIILGILIKMGAFPFYYWVPNVYQGSLNLIVAYFSTLSYISYFIFLLNFFFNSLKFLYLFYELLYISSIGSILIGVLGALYQTSVKRFMAYNSILNLGFILIGIISFIKVSYQDVENILLFIFIYFIFYSIMNVNNWTVLLSLTINKRPIKYLIELSALYMCNSFISYIFVIGLLSIAGLPPLIGFISKFFLIFIAILSKNYYLSAFALMFSIISIFYYLKILKIMIFDNLNLQIPVIMNKIDNNSSFVISLTLHFIIFYAFYFDFFFKIIRPLFLLLLI